MPRSAPAERSKHSASSDGTKWHADESIRMKRADRMPIPKNLPLPALESSRNMRHDCKTCGMSVEPKHSSGLPALSISPRRRKIDPELSLPSARHTCLPAARFRLASALRPTLGALRGGFCEYDVRFSLVPNSQAGVAASTVSISAAVAAAAAIAVSPAAGRPTWRRRRVAELGGARWPSSGPRVR
jgi:hypothetical protein